MLISPGNRFCLKLHLNYRMSLPEVADLMIEIGVINAINLDGGGSSTAVVNGSIVSYPSDIW